ncbi:hypothetical protein [uncultured Ruegeria sp.]|uniref:hypothetical protein n=1 Tax=uncultured Ruegeria sp. TaxID=259304 RepID=UPI00262A5A08|nr:hypothetical protein [uncultured Ruegeria sp.]
MTGNSVETSEQWRGMTPEAPESWLLRIYDGHLHYEILQKQPGQWELYFGDGKTRKVGQDNELVDVFPSVEKAKQLVEGHVAARRLASKQQLPE